MSLAEKACDPRRGQRGGARFNLIVVVVVIALAAYSAYNYAPVAYNAYLYRDYMQETVNRAAYPPVKSSEWVRQQLRDGGAEYGLPDDAQINVQNEGGRIAAHVTYTRAVQLPGYLYEYSFDHTARSSGFIR
jgi:heme A synthase